MSDETFAQDYDDVEEEVKPALQGYQATRWQDWSSRHYLINQTLLRGITENVLKRDVIIGRGVVSRKIHLNRVRRGLI